MLDRCRSRRRGVALVVAAGTALTTALMSAPAFSAAPAGDWHRQEPVPTSYTFRDVDMVTATRGWSVASPDIGDNGIIFSTSDGGVSWMRQGSAYRQLHTVSFADAQHGVALGNEYRYTTDGGDTWKQGTGSFGTMYDAELATATTGYATGSNLVIKTTDGGATWKPTTLPVNGNLVQIDVVDAQTVYVVGAQGSVFRTTDGGAKWTQVRSDSDKFYTGVSFVSATEGWVTGNAPATILHTTDAGAHWESQSVPGEADPARIRMADAEHGWAVGTLRTILHTADGGETWSLQQGGVYADPNNRYPLWGIDVVDAQTAVTAGAGVQVETTTDAGDSWVNRGNGSVTTPYRLVHTDAQHLWAADSNSEVLYSTDGGAHWDRSIIQIQQSCETCANTSDLSFLDDHEGWATINGLYIGESSVWHTADGGRSWQSLHVHDTGPLTGIAAIDAKTLVAVSAEQDVIFRSTDGGRSWKQVSHPAIPGFFGAVRFVPGTKTGWAVGRGGKILRSTDAGRTWTLQHGTGSQPNLFDVSFSDVKHGWAVGAEVLRTSNGGRTWKVQQTGLSIAYGVSAPSKKVGWLAGIEGIARTTNAGNGWTREDPAAGTWYSVTALDGATAWAGAQESGGDILGAIWGHGSAS